MGESPYRQMSEQHTRRLRQWDSPQPVCSVHQQQPQSLSPGAHNPWAAEAALEAHLQQAMVAVQALEHQRLCPQKLSQDGAESQHL